MSEQTPQPVLSVTRGTPTDEEIVALLLVVAAASGGDQQPEPERGAWAHRARNLGVAPLAGRRRDASAWRAGATPR